MMSASAISSAGAAGSYYEKDDYYTHDSPPSRWQGRGAKRLGLEGEVSKDQFESLLKGELPNGERLGTFRDGEWQHRPGTDLTFSAPKSVSIMAEVGQDERLIKAHDEAVAKALEHIEKNAASTRIREGGVVRSEQTGNLTIATFRHDLSRNADPQLHTHSVVLNCTQSADGQWRSVDNREFFRIQKEAGLIYRQELASRVRAAGYEIEHAKAGKDWGFEIKGVSEQVREHFSTRSQQIEKALEARGKDRESASAAEKEVVTLGTRLAKQDVDREGLREQWKAEAARNGLDVDVLRRQAEARASAPEFAKRMESEGMEKAGQAVRQAVDHLSERESIFTRKALEQEAWRFSNGSASMDQIKAQINVLKMRGELVPRVASDHRGNAQEGFTSKDLIRIEKENLSMERRGRAQAEPAVKVSALDKVRGITADQKAEQLVAKAERESARQGHQWTNDQREVTKALLSNRDKVVGIQGAAGTAKTSTVIRTFAAEVQRNGGRVVGMAPTNSAAQQLREGGGIESSKSIARHLADLRKEERAIAGLRYQAKVHEIKASQQAARADRPLKDGSLAITKNGTVLNRDGDGKWRRSHGMDAAVVKVAAGAKSAIHSVKSSYHKSQAESLREQADARTNAMRGQTWVVDEASMISSKQMNELLKAAEKYDARVVLVGDTQQLASVGAGRAFAQMQEHGMRTFKLEDIVRQRDSELRDAVMDAYRGRAAQALEKIDQRGGVKEIANPGGDREAGMQARAQAIAKDFVSLSKSDREKTIIIAPGHDDRAVINSAVRDQLKQEGSLSGAAVKVETLQSKGLTDAEKRSPDSYSKGDVVRFGREMKGLGIQKGEYLKVAGKEGEVVKLERASGELIAWNPSARGSGAGRTETFRPESKEFQVGDRIQITRNNETVGLSNKATGTIEKVAGDKLTVRTSDGQVSLDMSKAENRHLDHGYAMTAHSAQGATADRALVHAESHRLNLTNQRAEYVAISRARQEVTIYTDSKQGLRDALFRQTGEKSAALDQRDARLPAEGEAQKIQATPQKIKVTESPVSRFLEGDKGMDTGKSVASAAAAARESASAGSQLTKAGAGTGKELGQAGGKAAEGLFKLAGEIAKGAGKMLGAVGRLAGGAGRALGDVGNAAGELSKVPGQANEGLKGGEKGGGKDMDMTMGM